MMKTPFQILLITLSTSGILFGFVPLVAAQVSPVQAQLPNAGVVQEPSETAPPEARPMPETPDFANPWQERENEVEQQNQEEQSQFQEEYVTPANAEESNIEEPETIQEPEISPAPN